MKLLGSLHAVDARASALFQVSPTDLMEAAGMRVAEQVLQAFLNAPIAQPKILIVCGSGGNGGDGFVCARYLAQWLLNAQVTVLCTRPVRDVTSQMNLQQLHETTVTVIAAEYPQSEYFEGVTWIVDALLGTGLTQSVRPELAAWIEAINQANVPVVAVDIPSGLCSHTGAILGSAVQATQTVTLGVAKPGLFLYQGKHCAGKVTVVDIGLPQAAVDAEPCSMALLTAESVQSMLPIRSVFSHKNTYGRVLVIAGSKTMPGAGAMAAQAALRMGAGLVQWTLPQTVAEGLNIIPEVMLLPLSLDWTEQTRQLKQAIAQATVVLVGPGLSLSTQSQQLWQWLLPGLLADYTGTVVLDADALTLWAQQPTLLNARFIVTPHVGEAARMLQQDSTRIVGNLPLAAKQLVEKTQAIVVLKSATTVVCNATSPGWVNITGNNGLATAGSGDILAGLIAGLAAQGSEPISAASAGVYLHGLAGDIAVKSQTPYCLLATDILTYLPVAVQQLGESLEERHGNGLY